MLKFDLFENYVVSKSLMNVINQMNMKRYLYCHLSTSPRKPYLITWQSNFTKVKIIFRIDHSYTQLPHVQTSGMIVKNSGFLGKSCRYQMQLEALGGEGDAMNPFNGDQGPIPWTLELYSSFTGSEEPLQQLTIDKKIYFYFNWVPIRSSTEDLILFLYYLPELFLC